MLSLRTRAVLLSKPQIRTSIVSQSSSPLAKAMAATQRRSSTLPQGYAEDPSKGPMLRFQESLPRLPVPSLEETASRYVKSLRPLLTESELSSSVKAVEDFIKPGGVGRALQEKLVARRQDPDCKNWLSQWWTDVAYLSYRDPVVPSVSYFFAHRDDRRRRDPAKRAAAITIAALEFKRQVDTGSLEPDYMKGLPICMDSFKWMFNACRVAATPADYPVKFSHEDHKHIIVMRKNQVFKVPHEVGGKQLNAAEIEQQLRRIYETAERVPPVGALTSENRDVWADARRLLLDAHPSNAAALETIESASFVLCLDDAAPVTLEDRARSFWHGDGANRWYDKPCQFVVNDNGAAGFMGEHSMMDGTSTHRLNDTVNDLVFGDKLADLSATSIRSDLPEPQLVRLDLTPRIQDEISRAQRHFAAAIAETELAVQAYQGYGKGLIKRFKVSPDAYVQMMMQLAYHKMFGRNRPTYESAATRRFQEGRTETCRVVSEASVAWCDAMADVSVPDPARLDLFRRAVGSHLEYVTAASDGKGVDRHLLGLKKLLEPGQEVPAIFRDPAFAYSSSWFLSTSHLSSEYFIGYGWSQVIDDGFGIAYMIKENSINFNIASKKVGSQKLSFYINEAAEDMRDLLMSTMEPPKAKL